MPRGQPYDVWLAARKHHWTVIAVIFVGLAAGLGQALTTAPPPYAARAIFLPVAISIVAAFLLASVLDYVADRVKSPDDVPERLQVPCLGMVPLLNTTAEQATEDARERFWKGYRSLTRTLYSATSLPARVIAVGSAQRLEGKTMTACNLATALAADGARVLLVDADLQHPAIHERYDVMNTIGLMQLLAGQARVREAIQRTSDPNICIMAAGGTTLDGEELLTSSRMKQLIANLKRGPFDWVVIDTPPVLAARDAGCIAPLVDGVAFVLAAEKTRWELAEHALDRLRDQHATIIGAIVSRVTLERSRDVPFLHARRTQPVFGRGVRPARTVSA